MGHKSHKGGESVSAMQFQHCRNPARSRRQGSLCTPHHSRLIILAAFVMMPAGGWYIYNGGVVPHDVLLEDVAPQWYKWEGQDDNDILSAAAVLHC
eukprot:scaffold12161_cov81-Skeletonema_dohrnii-CCMP3373.AAC.6